MEEIWISKGEDCNLDAKISSTRVINVHVPSKYMSKIDRVKDLLQKRSAMKYDQMAELCREGHKCRRLTWKPEEHVWSDGKILIHTTSYFGEPFNQAIQGYPYVCEQVDIAADDWVVIPV